MKPWTSWFARVGIAGSCLLWAGCGGSNVPDPDSDSKAATAPAPGTTSAPPVAAVEPPSPPEPPAPAEPAPVAAAETTAEAPPAVAETDAAPAPDAPEPPAPKGEGASSTNEMLALAGAAPGENDASAADAASGSSGQSVPGQSSSANANPAQTDQERMAAAMAASGAYQNANQQSQQNGPSPEMMAAMMQQQQNSMQNSGMSSNEPGMDGAPSGPGGTLGPENFRNPQVAAAAFLAALKARDPDRLAQSTALRAPTEAGTKYQKVFAAILEQSLAPEDLDELAKKFEGMNIISANQAQSTGKYEIIVGGTVGTSQFHRSITLRKEKAGWKVLDISGAREFEKPIVLPRGRTGGSMGGGRR